MNTNPFNKCSAPVNDYHLPTHAKYTIEIKDCQCNVTNVLMGQLPLSTICDIEELEGIESAKNAWWESFLHIKSQTIDQDLNKSK